MEFAHQSVLLNECIDALAIKPDGIYLDGTLGGGGHSLQICRNLTTAGSSASTVIWSRWRPQKSGCTATQKR